MDTAGAGPPLHPPSHLRRWEPDYEASHSVNVVKHTRCFRYGTGVVRRL